MKHSPVTQADSSRPPSSGSQPTGARALYCGSAEIEKVYQAYCEEVARENLGTISVVRTAAYVYIDVARQWRLGRSLRTGCIHQWRARRTRDGEITWVRLSEARSFPLQVFSRISDADRVVVEVWQQRWGDYASARSARFNRWQDRLMAAGRGEGGRVPKRIWAITHVGYRQGGSKERRSLVAKAFFRAMWDHLIDRDVLRLAMPFFPFGRMSFQAYNMVVRARSYFQVRLQESPSLAPLLGLQLRPEDPYRNALAPARAMEEFIVSQDAVRALWLKLHAQGLSRAGWKVLCATPGHVLQGLTAAPDGGQVTYRLTKVFNTLALARVRAQDVPASVFRTIYPVVSRFGQYLLREEGSAQRQQVQRVIVRALGAYVEEAQRRRAKKTLRAFLRDEAPLVWDWLAHLFDEQEGVMRNDPVQPSATWASLMRKQRQWHEQAAEREKERRARNRRASILHRRQTRQTTWESLLPRQTRRAQGQVFEVVPLTKGLQLEREGRVMRHCVGGYTPACARNQSRVFHVTATGKNVAQEATIELQFSARKWIVGQVYGPRNAPAAPGLHRLAKALARDYTAAWKAQNHAVEG